MIKLEYLGSENLLKNGAVIGSGIDSTSHKITGGYRIDFKNRDDFKYALYPMDFVFEGDNGKINGVYSGRYAVYKLVGIPVYTFYIHGVNFKRGHVSRNDKFFDPYGIFWTHLHMKVNGYSSATKTYLEYLRYFDPRIKIKNESPSKLNYNVNTGNPLPFPNIINTEMIKLKYRDNKTVKITWKIRPETVQVRVSPRLDAKTGRTMLRGQEFITSKPADGQDVDGNSTWYKVGKQEWLPGRWLEFVKAEG